MMAERKETRLTPVEPLSTPEQAAEAWTRFQALKEKLLSPEDYALIQNKRFITRSGFRKIAVVFGISDRIVKEERVDRADGSFVWRITVEVEAPNGRLCSGVGACDSKERRFAHVEHDVFATAHTRAKSRAISDMVAGGIVSAEEMEAAASIPEQQSQDKAVLDASSGFETLPWQAFKEKRAALPDEPGWIFSNTPEAEGLATMLRKEGAYVTVKMGEYEFDVEFSGEGNMFIRRTTPKEVST